LMPRPTTTWSACTSTLDSCAGEGWVAVGDVAIAHDPLAGQGLLFAIESASIGAQAIQRHLLGSVTALPLYDEAVRARAEAYLTDRGRVYARQSRWPDRPFWQRRQPPVRGAPIHVQS
jgi:2-polyprenyl-6-methoxyphenol hydroxylase-like FAD-dependent oxidoreductase